jgi:hypothetical protein
MNDEIALVSNDAPLQPREAKRTNDTTFDRIYKSIHNSKTRIELTVEEIRISNRWDKAWLLLCRHRTKKQVADLIMKLFNVGMSVAYDDVRKAMMLYSDPTQDERDGKRLIAETAFLRGADKAWKNGNLDMHLKYMKEYTEINKLREDAGADMGELIKSLKPTQIIIVSTKQDLEAEATKLQEQLIQDITHTEVDESTED